MINSLFFVLRTCCKVPKSYGKSLNFHSTSHAMDYAMNARRMKSQVFRFSIIIISQ